MNDTDKSQFYIILLIVLLSFIGNSIAYPVLTPLFLHSSGNDILPKALAAHGRGFWLGLTLMMYPLGQFIGSPILGALSDHFGRKKLLIVTSSLITGLYLLTALSLSFRLLWILILARFLTGCCEGNISIARSMVVDISALNKHKSFGLINAMSALGYILGPLIGGFLADHQIVPGFDYALPFYVATILAFLLSALIIVFLRETIHPSPVIKFNFTEQFNFIKRLKHLCQNKELKILLIASSIASLSHDIFYEFYPAYLVALWQATPSKIAVYTAILSAAIALGSAWLSHTLAHYLLPKRILQFALLTLVVSMLLLILPPPEIITVLLFFIIGLAIALCATNFTLQVSESSGIKIQGEVLGTLWGLRMLLDGLTALIGGCLIIFSYSLPLFFAALFALISWLIYKKKEIN